ncbi:MAG: lipopolysaccharide transport periplasmic protein LptA [Burkholderiales bacterium]|nr:lipopolysaccharide transport periplasmic protein LptA [Burkholderiales bacterium]
MLVQSIKYFSAAAAVALLALPVCAEKADRDQDMVVTYKNRAENDNKTQTVTLDGDVHVVQGTLTLVCDHAVVVKSADGSDQHVTAVGHPATFRERMDDGQWLDGHSDKIEYDSKSGDVLLVGHGWMKRGEQDELNSQLVTYNMNTEVYTAEDGKRLGLAPSPNQQSVLIIHPKKKAAAGDKPAPAAAAPAGEQAKP